MKGGRDMKKIYTMFNEEEFYCIKDNDNDVFKISKKSLNVDGKEMFNSFFKEFKKNDEIVINKDKSFSNDDKLSLDVYENIKEIIEKIQDGINNVE